MKRRRAIQTLAGMSVAGALPSAHAQQAPAQPQPRTVNETPKLETVAPDAVGESVPRFFSADQFAALRRLAEVLMPAAGDTPGAKEAGAAEFFDFLIGQSPTDRQTLYGNGLDQLNARARSRYAKSFADLTITEIEPLLAPLRESWTYGVAADPFARFLQAAKLDILRATMNSREWSVAFAKRNRRASGLGNYWYPIE